MLRANLYQPINLLTCQLSLDQFAAIRVITPPFIKKYKKITLETLVTKIVSIVLPA